MTMIGTYPPSAFSFTVMVAGTGTALQLGGMADGSFQEASGLEAKIETEPVSEGGENGFVHQLPLRPNLPIWAEIMNFSCPSDADRLEIRARLH